MNVEVFLTSANIGEADVRDRTVIVIDVLRACSTIVTALDNGARAVVPVADMAEAGKIASNLDQTSYLLGGERGSEKIEGYHLGNSPLEYVPGVVENRTIILNTTNGTAAITQSRAAEHLLIGCFLNAGSVVAFARKAAIDVTIICAGWRNRVSLEDTLCAGLFLHRLWDGQEPERISDTAHIAFTQYEHDKTQFEAAIRRCNHAQLLEKKGFGADVEYCLRINALPLLPHYVDNRLVLYNRAEKESAF
jgi:2-phosphosulfolactate phosphatase